MFELPKEKMIELRFCNREHMWTHRVQVPVSFIFTMPAPTTTYQVINNQTTPVKMWMMEWVSVQGVNENYTFKPEHLVGYSIIEV